MSINVGNIDYSGSENYKNNNVRPKTITKMPGKKLKDMAAEFGMTTKEFIKWTNLKVGSKIKVGDVIELPTATAEPGKGIYAVARKYGMTMAEFSKINRIKDPNNYKAKSGEVFYVKLDNVKPKASNKSSKHITINKKSINGLQKIANSSVINSTTHSVEETIRMWGSAYSPEELAEKIYDVADKKWGAVGRPDFDALIDEINPKNASAVIEAYTKYEENKNKVSLINTITSERISTPNARKAAVMKVYDALAQEKGATEDKREEFLEELDKQFDSWGMVSTKKLDSIISELLKMKTIPAANFNLNFYRNKASETKDNKKVVVPNSKYPQTVASLKAGSIQATKQEVKEKFRKFCSALKIPYNPNMLNTVPIERIPNPVLDSNGKIVPYVSELLRPTCKPNGKVIIVNSGHGGYNPSNGVFDVGSYSFVMKADGKYAPHFEYDKVQLFVNNMVNKLRAEGYAVVVTQGSYIAYSNTKVLTRLYNNLASGNKAGGHKFSKNDMAFISFHADSSILQNDKNDTSSVCYKPGYSETKILADSINKNLNNHYISKNFKSELAQRIPGKNGVYILNESTPQIPTVLLETAHINGEEGRKHLDSSDYMDRYTNRVLTGLNEYFGIEQR